MSSPTWTGSKFTFLMLSAVSLFMQQHARTVERKERALCVSQLTFLKACGQLRLIIRHGHHIIYRPGSGGFISLKALQSPLGSRARIRLITLRNKNVAFSTAAINPQAPHHVYVQNLGHTYIHTHHPQSCLLLSHTPSPSDLWEGRDLANIQWTHDSPWTFLLSSWLIFMARHSPFTTEYFLSAGVSYQLRLATEGFFLLMFWNKTAPRPTSAKIFLTEFGMVNTGPLHITNFSSLKALSASSFYFTMLLVRSVSEASKVAMLLLKGFLIQTPKESELQKINVLGQH